MARGPAEVAHGQMFIGFTINVLLCGIMITQVYLYSVTYKKDPKWIKIVVALVFLADLLNTAFDFTYLYRTLIKFYGRTEVLNQADWIFATDPALTGLIAMSVQFFFAWRVKVLTKSWIFTTLIFLMALAGGIAGIWTAVEVGRTPTFTEFQKFKATVIVWLAAEVVADVMITGILRKHKTGFPNSDLIVDRIIRITVQTGLITMIVASLDLITFLTDPTGTHLIFNFPLCKLYTNSLMSSLNSRKGWNFSVESQKTITDSEGQINTTSGVSGRGQNLSFHTRDIKSTGGVQVGVTSRPEVFVHVESHELVDVPNHARVQGVIVPQKPVKNDFDSSRSSLEGTETEKRWKHPYYTP